MLAGLEEVCRLQMRIVEQVVDRVDGGAGQVGGVQNREPFGRAAPEEACRQTLVERVDHRRPGSAVIESSLTRPVGAAGRLEESAPMRAGIGHHGDEAVGGPIGAAMARQHA
jgi:hypothetical protein